LGDEFRIEPWRSEGGLVLGYRKAKGELSECTMWCCVERMITESYNLEVILISVILEEGFNDAFTSYTTRPGCLIVCGKPDHTVSDLSKRRR
jgi:hypothetical protein